jgi:hypothetical protein
LPEEVKVKQVLRNEKHIIKPYILNRKVPVGCFMQKHNVFPQNGKYFNNKGDTKKDRKATIRKGPIQPECFQAEYGAYCQGQNIYINQSIR